MVDRSEARSAIEYASDIVVAYLANHSLSPLELVELVRQLRAELERDASQSSASPQPSTPVSTTGVQAPEPEQVRQPHERRPAVPIESSVTPDYIISLEDGRAFRSLTRHLMAKHGLSPAQYREKWGLPDDYPMVAPSYARERSEVAKRIGLGKASMKAGPRVAAPRRAHKPA